MQYVQKNNDIISVQTGEIRARIVMLNTEEVRFGIMYGVINEMDRDEILDYVASYSGVNGVFETFESAMAHAMASMQPVPTPFAADHYEAIYQQSGYARQIAGETPEMAHAHHEAIEAVENAYRDDNGDLLAAFCFNQFKGTCKQAQQVLGDLFTHALPDDIKDAITYINEYASRFDEKAALIHHNFRQSAKWWFQHKFDVPQKHWALFI